MIGVSKPYPQLPSPVTNSLQFPELSVPLPLVGVSHDLTDPHHDPVLQQCPHLVHLRVLHHVREEAEEDWLVLPSNLLGLSLDTGAP